MAQHDYLMRQIQMLTLFLAKLISRLLHVPDNENPEEAEKAVFTAFSEELKIDLKELLFLSDTDFLKVVRENFPREEHLDKLAEVLFLIGKNIQFEYTPTRQAGLQKAFALFEFLQGNSPDFSVERSNRMMQIRELLN
jgi:hypothetical protein